MSNHKSVSVLTEHLDNARRAVVDVHGSDPSDVKDSFLVSVGLGTYVKELRGELIDAGSIQRERYLAAFELLDDLQKKNLIDAKYQVIENGGFIQVVEVLASTKEKGQ